MNPRRLYAFVLFLASAILAPRAVAQPGCLTVTGPDSATDCPAAGGLGFLVSVSGGNGFYTYQWQIQTAPGTWLGLGPTPIPLPCGGTAFADPLNSFGVTIGITPCTGLPPGVAQRFQIRCVIASACGSATSNQATYTVCPADFNCSGSVTVQDLFDFLGAWFSHDAAADIDGSGSVSIQDLFDYLAAWFAGC